jgi:hypothetical protein
MKNNVWGKFEPRYVASVGMMEERSKLSFRPYERKKPLGKLL